MINIRGLHKSHRGREVLHGIDAHVARGETIAIVGPSGGGKTTLLRCLNYLDPFQAGLVEIAGFTLRPDMGRTHREEVRRLRCAVGIVFQELNLFPHLTAAENITLAPRLVRGRTEQDALARARSLLARVGLADHESAYPHQLSGGQKQRVAIARALAQEPEVLLFDEPTSALDPGWRDDVLEVIQSLSADGMTMLVVTHEMHFAHDVAHRVWVMDGGRIVEEGAPSEVVDTPKSTVAKEFFRRLALK